MATATKKAPARPTITDAPLYVALEHRAVATTRLQGRKLDHAEWLVERVRDGAEGGDAACGIRVTLTFCDGSGITDNVRVSIASTTDGPVDNLSPKHFRQLVEALNAAAAALPDDAQPPKRTSYVATR